MTLKLLKFFTSFLIGVGLLCVKFHYVSIYYPEIVMILLLILIVIWIWSIVQVSKHLKGD